MSSQLVFRLLAEDEFRLLTLLPATSLSASLIIQCCVRALRNAQLRVEDLSYPWTSILDGNDHSNDDLYELVDVDGHETFLCNNLAM
jgi:hypothetical protein